MRTLHFRQLVLAFLLVSSAFATAQNIADEDIRQILQEDVPFSEIVKRGDAYFAKKHPGRTPKDLSRGAYRDGKFVKFQRWQNYWQYHLKPDGHRGYPADYLPAKPAAGKSNGNPYADVAWSNLTHQNYIVGQIGMGRTTSISFHPTDADVFYVGSGNGGIWRTTDGGQTYEPLGDDLPFLSVSSIVVNQQNPQELFIAVSDHVFYGYAGIGVYRSADGGQTWQPTSLTFDLAQNVRIYRLAADPSDPQTMLAATAQGIYRTDDGWQSRTLVRSGRMEAITYRPGSSAVAYAADNAGRFYRSTDGGQSWTLVNDFGDGRVNIAVTTLDPNRVLLSLNGGAAHESLDGGLTFPNSFTLGETRSDQQIAYSPRTPNTIVAGYFELFRSDNGGASFTQSTDWLGNNGLYHMHVDMRSVHVNPLQPDKVYWCNDGGVYRQDVDDNSFENLCDGLLITQYYDIATAQSDPNVVSGGSQDNGSLYRSADQTWDDFAATGDGMVTEIDPTDAGIRYWEYQNGGMRRWTNGSNTGIAPPGKDGNGAWETPYKLDPSNPARLVCGFDVVYESTNRGGSWSAISGQLAGGGNLAQIAIAPSDPDQVYASRGATVYARQGATSTWTSSTVPSGMTVTDLEVDPNDASIVYAANGGYLAGSKVYRSADRGVTWQNISGTLPNLPVSSLELYHDAPGAIFVGTYAGVYYRDDNTSDWLEYGSLPHTDVRDIEVQYTTQMLRVGTHGRGMFEAAISIEACTAASPDTDGDGICDQFDACPDLDDSLIGTPCDDGIAQTVNSVYQTDCGCGGGVSNLTYCAAAGSAGTGSDYITRVELNEIRHSSGKSAYSDFNAVRTDLARGATYGISVDLGGVFALDKVYAWIDYNRDGTFSNADELISFGPFAGTSTSATFTVPADADPASEITTMRVRVIYADPNNPDPCDNYFGEVEDYGVRLTGGGPACTPGTACDDGDACTTGDLYDADCNCAGTVSDADGDGVCDADDACPGFNDNLIGTACDDGNACTDTDLWTNDCNCAGTLTDADGDGVCDADDVCPGFDDNLIGTACDDGDACTTGETYQTDCNCAGGTPVPDSDGDGVCDAEDVCPGGDDTIDADGNGTPDDCDVSCVQQTGNFPTSALSHSGGGSAGTTLLFTEATQDVSFTISGLNAKLNGKGSGRYIERVTVIYVNQAGNTVTYGTYRGDQVSSAAVSIAGTVQSVTVRLDDAYDGSSGTTMTVNLSPVSLCAAPCDDADGDGVCDAADQCPGFDDTLDTDNDGVPDGCDNCTNVNTNFSANPLTHSGGGSSVAFANLSPQTDVSFTISQLGARTGGKPRNRFSEVVTVTYRDGNGTVFTYGTFSGVNQSSVNVSIPGAVSRVEVTLSNGTSGSSTALSVNLSPATGCAAGAALRADESAFSTSAEVGHGFILFPNPARGAATFRVDNPAGTESVVELFSPNGRMLQTHRIAGTGVSTGRLPLDGLPAGVYLVRSRVGELVLVRRLVVLE